MKIVIRISVSATNISSRHPHLRQKGIATFFLSYNVLLIFNVNAQLPFYFFILRWKQTEEASNADALSLSKPFSLCRAL